MSATVTSRGTVAVRHGWGELSVESASIWSFPGDSGVKNPPPSAGDVGDPRVVSLIPGSGRSPGIGHGNSLQYSCLENPMDRGAW